MQQTKLTNEIESPKKQQLHADSLGDSILFVSKEDKIKESKRKWNLKNPDYHKEWKKKNLERIKIREKEYRREHFSKPENKEKRRAYQVEFEKNNPIKKERRYFLTKKANAGFDKDFYYEDYKKLELKQKGLCAICKKEDKKRSLSIDHCHTTLKVRGLLCKKCNSAIGFFEDDKRLLKNAIKYLNL